MAVHLSDNVWNRDAESKHNDFRGLHHARHVALRFIDDSHAAQRFRDRTR